MLDNDASRFCKLANSFPSRIAIGNIVVGQSLAVQLFVACQKAFTHMHFTVESRLLVGIFTVTHVLNLHELTSEAFREIHLLLVFVQGREVVGNHGIIASGMAEHFLC